MIISDTLRHSCMLPDCSNNIYEWQSPLAGLLLNLMHYLIRDTVVICRLLTIECNHSTYVRTTDWRKVLSYTCRYLPLLSQLSSRSFLNGSIQNTVDERSSVLIPRPLHVLLIIVKLPLSFLQHTHLCSSG